MTIKIRPLALPERSAAPGQIAAATLGRPVRALAAALFFGILAIYLFTLSARFAPDGVAFARLVDFGRLDRPGIFQTEHLLYPFVGWVWYQVWRYFGFEHGSLAALQVLNALCGAIGVTALFLAARLALRAWRGSLMPSLVVALVVGTTHAYWRHSTDAEAMMPALATVAVAFLLLLWIRGRSAPSSAVLIAFGLILALAPLLHGTQILFWPIALAGLYWPRRDRRRLILPTVVALATLALAYGLIGGLVLGLRTPGEFVLWATSAPRVGVWGRFDPSHLPVAVKTLADTIVNLQGGPRLRELVSGPAVGANLLALLLLLALVSVGVLVTGILVRRWRQLPDPSLAKLCLAWAALYGVFALFWAPEDGQFWITPVIPLTFLAAFAYLILRDAVGATRDLLAGISLFGVTTLVTINAVTGLVPRSDITVNVDYQRAICLKQRLADPDLIISVGWDWVGTYVPYFTLIDHVSLTDLHLGPGGRDLATTRALLDEQIRAARAAGGRVWTVNLFDLSPSQQEWFERSTGLSPANFADLRGEVDTECLGAPVRAVPDGGGSP